ncbi:MAG: hypothetical protein KF842_03410 [Caulobacter sp.]|nr:hypothetical protein [Caulobacter sp.]
MTAVTLRARCQCGKVVYEARGRPILSAVCYCNDCQEGGRRIEALPGAPPALEPDGGSAYLTWRDDRFACVAGADLLAGHRLSETAPTRRMVATCCNSAMYLKFGPGHWVSAWRNRFEGDLPPIEMRTMLRRRRSELPLPDAAPTHQGHPASLFVRLIGARLAMLLGR